MADTQQYPFFHPWHSLPIGQQFPSIVQAVIEIQQGSKAKYELDKATGFLRLDRILSSGLAYPFHYGFIPQTLCQDNDPLDIVLLCSEPLLPLSIVDARVIGGINMIDDGQQDDKIIAVAHNDPFMSSINELSDLAETMRETIRYFFQNYKKNENKIVEVEAFLDRAAAFNIVTESAQCYGKEFVKK